MVEQGREEWVARHLGRLLRHSPERVTLDEIGEAIGTEAVTPDDIEALLAALEARGVRVGEAHSADLPALLREVLAAARELKKAGKPPSRGAIAARIGLSERAVRVALLYADVLRG